MCSVGTRISLIPLFVRLNSERGLKRHQPAYRFRAVDKPDEGPLTGRLGRGNSHGALTVGERTGRPRDPDPG